MGFIPEVFSPAIRLEQKQLHILDRGRPARLVGDVTLPAAGAHSNGVYVMWPSFIRSRSPRHRVANRSAELVRAGPDYRRVRNGNQDNAQCYQREASQSERNPAAPLLCMIRNAPGNRRMIHSGFITRTESVPTLAVLLARITNSDGTGTVATTPRQRHRHDSDHDFFAIRLQFIGPCGQGKHHAQGRNQNSTPEVF